jgi:NAD(P)-dependent dehydrogenase (short-subunit alcohol dehydrogenase family)
LSKINTSFLPFQSNEVAIVTGGASGIGRGITLRLAQLGVRVIIADLLEEKSKIIQQSCYEKKGEVIFIKTDLSQSKDIEQLVDKCVKRFGRLDFVINNARPNLKIRSFEENFSEWDLAMNVLLKAPALLTNFAGKHMKKKGGSIVNISSTNAIFVSHQPVAYHVAKAGLLQLTRVLACEYAQYGIRVNAVCPALVDLFDRKNHLTGDPLHKTVTELIVPMKRAAFVEEIADAVIFLCSEASSYTTGQVLTIDGGFH